MCFKPRFKRAWPLPADGARGSQFNFYAKGFLFDARVWVNTKEGIKLRDLHYSQHPSPTHSEGLALLEGLIEGLFQLVFHARSKVQWLSLRWRELENFLRDENHIPLNLAKELQLDDSEIQGILLSLLAAVEQQQMLQLELSLPQQIATERPLEWDDLLTVGSYVEKILDQLNTHLFAPDSGYSSLAGIEKDLWVLDFHGNCRNCSGLEVSLSVVQSFIQSHYPFFQQTKLVALTDGKR